MAQQVFTRYGVPSKGLWTSAAADSIGPEYTPWCQNVRFRFGRVVRTPGRSKALQTMASDVNIIDFAIHTREDGTRDYWTLEKKGAANQISLFDAGSNSFGTTQSLPMTTAFGSRYSWTQGEEKLFVCRASEIVAVDFDGTLITLEQLTAPNAMFVEYFKNHLVAMNLVGHGNVLGHSNWIQWSRAANYNDWQQGEDAQGIIHGGQLELYDGAVEPITGGKVLNDRLVIYRNSSITDLNATGDALNAFLPENRVFGIGCLLPWSLVSLGQFHIFVGNDFNIYAWDGANLDPIGSPIHQYVRQLFDPYTATDALHIPFAAAFRGFKEYWLVIPERGTENHIVLIYDYYRNSWTRDVFTSLYALMESIQMGPTGTRGFDATGFPMMYPLLFAGAGNDFFMIDERVTGDWYDDPQNGGMDMFFDTPDMYYAQNGMGNGTLERMVISSDLPRHGGEPPYELLVSVDRGNSFPYGVVIVPEDRHWGFEFADTNLTSNVRRYRFFYPKQNGPAAPTLRAYTDVYIPSGEFFPINQLLNPQDPNIPTTGSVERKDGVPLGTLQPLPPGVRRRNPTNIQ